jgi:hypothetical protein
MVLLELKVVVGGVNHEMLEWCDQKTQLKPHFTIEQSVARKEQELQ